MRFACWTKKLCTVFLVKTFFEVSLLSSAGRVFVNLMLLVHNPYSKSKKLDVNNCVKGVRDKVLLK